MNRFFDSVGVPQIYFPEIGFSEAIDIAIMAMLIYYVINWIRKTHAWALLKGILIFAMIALLAHLFDLVTVMWMVQNAFAMGLIALVILFQPELRKALEKIGKGVDLGLGGNEDKKGRLAEGVIDEITEAVMLMASRRTGALICIERDVSLEDLANTGILIDGLVTRQLLINIFVNRTPLHDGAIVVRYNRVVSATCILPLTTTEVDHELGTRHRAALGASEASDALVVVVSEETGSISVAVNGELNRNLEEAQLRQLLATGRKAERKKRRLIPWKKRKTLP